MDTPFSVDGVLQLALESLPWVRHRCEVLVGREGEGGREGRREGGRKEGGRERMESASNGGRCTGCEGGGELEGTSVTSLMWLESRSWAFSGAIKSSFLVRLADSWTNSVCACVCVRVSECKGKGVSEDEVQVEKWGGTIGVSTKEVEYVTN